MAIRLLAPLAAVGSVCARFVSGMTGQSRYAAYLAHERERHPDGEPLTEREFWREIHRAQDLDPGGRCC
ncbi:YbdD/YjiX family protein [Microbacterium sp. JZ70]